jgi:hypothetical protein
MRLICLLVAVLSVRFTYAVRVESHVGLQWNLTAVAATQAVFAIEGRSKELIAYEAWMATLEDMTPSDKSTAIASNSDYPQEISMTSTNMNTLGAYNLVQVDTETGSIYNETGPNRVLSSPDFEGVDISQFGYNFECLAAHPIDGTIWAISQTQDDAAPAGSKLGQVVS